MTRGLAEMGRLGEAAGGDPDTFAGLAGMGDLIVTCWHPSGRNRRAGELIARGQVARRGGRGDRPDGRGPHDRARSEGSFSPPRRRAADHRRRMYRSRRHASLRSAREPDGSAAHRRVRVWLAAALGAIALAGLRRQRHRRARRRSGSLRRTRSATSSSTRASTPTSGTRCRPCSTASRAEPQLVVELDKQLAEEQLQWERDVEPALGDSVAVIWVGQDGRATSSWATQPDDDAKLDALVEKLADEADTDYVIGELDGWTLVAERQAAIDALKAGDGELADDDGYQAALDELPDERLAFGWVRKEALPDRTPRQLELRVARRRDRGARRRRRRDVRRASTGEAGASYTSRRSTRHLPTRSCSSRSTRRASAGRPRRSRRSRACSASASTSSSRTSRARARSGSCRPRDSPR